MYEFNYKLNGKAQRIQAKSADEVKRMIPDATEITKGHIVNQATLVNTPERGKVIDPGRSSIV